MAVVYFDGGEYRLERKSQIISWGIVIKYGDEFIELSGARLAKADQRGYHELIAFLEMYLYLKSHGLLGIDFTFFTDDECLSQAAFWLHEGNYCNKGRIRPRLAYICETMFSNVVGLYSEALEFLKTKRIMKVKGHARSIYNLRVDFLSSLARASHLGKHMEVTPFEDWIDAGFNYYPPGPAWRIPMALVEPSTWYAPFTGPQQ